jgi:hypothetical protein
MRGFSVARDFFYGSSRIWVSDEKGAIPLIVMSISNKGAFPNPNDFESMAAVYQDGRIEYSGRNPIVQSEVLKIEIENVTTVSEIKSKEGAWDD